MPPSRAVLGSPAGASDSGNGSVSGSDRGRYAASVRRVKTERMNRRKQYRVADVVMVVVVGWLKRDEPAAGGRPGGLALVGMVTKNSLYSRGCGMTLDVARNLPLVAAMQFAGSPLFLWVDGQMVNMTLCQGVCYFYDEEDGWVVSFNMIDEFIFSQHGSEEEAKLALVAVHTALKARADVRERLNGQIVILKIRNMHK